MRHRLDFQPLYQVNLYFSQFSNDDLSKRGYYQVRIKPIQSDNIESIELKVDISDAGTISDLVTRAHVDNGIGYSKILEVNYSDEVISIDNVFTINARLKPVKNVNEIEVLDVEMEVWFLERQTVPIEERFEFRFQQVVKITLDPTNVFVAARPIPFAWMDKASVTIGVYSALVNVKSSVRKNSFNSFFSSSKSRIQSQHTKVAHALVYTIKSIQIHILKCSKLTGICVDLEPIDAEKEIQESCSMLDLHDTNPAMVESLISKWNDMVSITFDDFIRLFIRSNKVWVKLAEINGKARRNQLGEAFFYCERLKTELRNTNPWDQEDCYNFLKSGKYLELLPELSLRCTFGDAGSESCSVIFEECYSSGERFVPESSSHPQPDGHIEPEQETETNDKTMSTWEDVINRGASSPVEHGTPPIDEKMENALLNQINKSCEQGEDPSTSRLPFADTSTYTSSRQKSEENVSKDDRCSAAGENYRDKTETSKTDIVSEVVQEHDVISAVNPENREAGMENIDLKYENPMDRTNILNFLKERRELMMKLNSKFGYDGHLQSEKAETTLNIPGFVPVESDFARKVSHSYEVMPKKFHLVIFVHGLEGSPLDLCSYRWYLKQSLESLEHCRKLENEEIENRWEYRFQMSECNDPKTTWSDIRELGKRFLGEVKEFVEELRAVHRISFVCHSLGGLIVRAAIDEAMKSEAKWLTDFCYTLFTLNTPHLGLPYISRAVDIIATATARFKNGKCVNQLFMRDAVLQHETFLYQLSAGDTFGVFRNVLMVGSKDDMYVPYHSSVLVPCKNSIKDMSSFGTCFRDMMSNITSKAIKSEKLENLVRYTVWNRLPTSTASRAIGRAAHIAPLDDVAFVEKICTISAAKYFT